MSTSAMCVAIEWPRVPVALSERMMTLRVRLPTCGRKSRTPFRSRAPRWSYCNAALSVTLLRSDEIAVTVRSSHWLTVFIQPPPVTSLSLMCRVSGRTRRSPICQPDTASDKLNVVWPARGSEPRRVKVGVRGVPCIVALPRIDDAGAEAERIRHAAANRGVGDEDFRGHAGGNRGRGIADFQEAGRAHAHLARHHLQVRDLQARVDARRECELAVDRHRVRNGRRVVDRHGMARHDADDVIRGRDLATLPRRRVRPRAALDRAHRRPAGIE